MYSAYHSQTMHIEDCWDLIGTQQILWLACCKVAQLWLDSDPAQLQVDQTVLYVKIHINMINIQEKK